MTRYEVLDFTFLSFSYDDNVQRELTMRLRKEQESPSTAVGNPLSWLADNITSAISAYIVWQS